MLIPCKIEQFLANVTTPLQSWAFNREIWSLENTN